MSTAGVDTEGSQSEADKVEEWRLKCLLRAGWPLELAEKIAPDTAVDLRIACEMVSKHGCHPDVAFKILS